MNVEDTEQPEFSLAELADMDVSDIAEVRFEQLPPGQYVFRGIEAKLDDVTNRDDERRIVGVFVMEVAEVKSVLARGVDKEELIGKKHTEKQYIVPAKAAEGIGLLRSFLKDLHLPNEGNLGGVEGANPGLLENFAGHEFTGKIVQKPMKGSTDKIARLQLEKVK